MPVPGACRRKFGTATEAWIKVCLPFAQYGASSDGHPRFSCLGRDRRTAGSACGQLPGALRQRRRRVVRQSTDAGPHSDRSRSCFKPSGPLSRALPASSGKRARSACVTGAHLVRWSFTGYAVVNYCMGSDRLEQLAGDIREVKNKLNSDGVKNMRHSLARIRAALPKLEKEVKVLYEHTLEMERGHELAHSSWVECHEEYKRRCPHWELHGDPFANDRILAYEFTVSRVRKQRRISACFENPIQ